MSSRYWLIAFVPARSRGRVREPRNAVGRSHPKVYGTQPTCTIACNSPQAVVQSTNTVPAPRESILTTQRRQPCWRRQSRHDQTLSGDRPFSSRGRLLAREMLLPEVDPTIALGGKARRTTPRCALPNDFGTYCGVHGDRPLLNQRFASKAVSPQHAMGLSWRRALRRDRPL